MFKKLVKWLSVLVVLGVVTVVTVVFFMLGIVVKAAVEKGGPYVTKTPVTLESAKISPRSGEGTLRGFKVANPEGFKTDSAIYAGEVFLKLDPASVTSEKVVIQSMRVMEPSITIEAGNGGTNLKKLLDNVQSSSKKVESDEKEKAPPSDDGEKAAAKKLQVDEFVISGAKVSMSASFLNGKSASVTIPEIRLENLGQGPEGITAAELSRLIVKELLSESTGAMSGKLAELGVDATEIAEGLGEGAKDFVKDLGDNLEKAIQGDGGESLKEAGKKIGKGISDLFKKGE